MKKIIGLIGIGTGIAAIIAGVLKLKNTSNSTDEETTENDENEAE